MLRSPRNVFHVGLVLVFMIPATVPTIAADVPAKKTRPDKPIFVVNFASVNRSLTGSDRVLKLADRSDLSFALRSVIALSTGGLKGVDRTRPFGFMTMIDQGDVPEPVAVGYIPIANSDEFLTMLKTAGLKIAPVDRKPGYFRLSVENTPLVMRVQNGYAFVARQEKSLERKFTDPAVMFRQISARHDAALHVPFADIPTEMKTMILDYLRARGEVSAPQRRSEAASEHALRTAITAASLSGLHSLMMDADSLTFGVSISNPKSPVEASLRVVASERSRLAKAFAAVHGKSTLDQRGDKTSSFEMAGCACLPEGVQKLLTAIFARFAESSQSVDVPRLPNRSVIHPAITAFKPVLIDAGSEVTVRVSGNGQQATWIVAVRPADAKTLERHVKTALQQLKKNRRVKSIEKIASTGESKTITRLTSADGDSPAAFAVDRGVLWLAVGPGKIGDRLSAEMNASRARPTPRTPSTRLLQMSLQARLLNSLLTGKFAETDAAGFLRLTIDQSGRQLSLRTTLEAAVIRQIARMMLPSPSR